MGAERDGLVWKVEAISTCLAGVAIVYSASDLLGLVVLRIFLIGQGGCLDGWVSRMVKYGGACRMKGFVVEERCFLGQERSR